MTRGDDEIVMIWVTHGVASRSRSRLRSLGAADKCACSGMAAPRTRINDGLTTLRNYSHILIENDMTAALKHVTHAVRRNNPRQSMARKGARLVRCELNLRRGIVGVNVRVHTCGDNLSSLQHTTQGFSAWDRRPYYLVTTQHRGFIAITDGRAVLISFLAGRTYRTIMK